MIPLRCRHCHGNLYLEEFTSSDWRSPFTGFELKCLACSRIERTISMAELIAYWGVSIKQARIARWHTLSFVWLCPDPQGKPAVKHREMALAG